MARTKRLRNVHPGEILVEEFLNPMGLSQYALAKAMHVPLTRVAAICARRRAITADTAMRLGRLFGTSPKFWLGLQQDFDLEQLARSPRKGLAAIRPLVRAA